MNRKELQVIDKQSEVLEGDVILNPHRHLASIKDLNDRWKELIARFADPIEGEILDE